MLRNERVTAVTEMRAKLARPNGPRNLAEAYFARGNMERARMCSNLVARMVRAFQAPAAPMCPVVAARYALAA
jgi:hypothetical protein